MISSANKDEITLEMIEAGAAVIWRRPDLDVGPSGAKDLAEAVLLAALQVRCSENPARE